MRRVYMLGAVACILFRTSSSRPAIYGDPQYSNITTISNTTSPRNCNAELQTKLAQHGLPSNTNISSITNKVFFDELNRDPCFEYITQYSDNDRAIDEQIVYSQLIYALDWAHYKWRDVDRANGKFHPQNVYGMSIQIDRTDEGWPGFSLSNAIIGYMIDTIGFFMLDDNRFREVRAGVTNWGKEYATVVVTKAALAQAGNTTSPQHLPTTKNSTSAADIDQTIFTKRGASPHAFDPNIRCDITAVATVDRHLRYEFLHNMLFLGREALSHRRQKSIEAGSPGDVLVWEAEPLDYRTQVLGEDVLDCLIDVVEWEWAQWAQSRAFKLVRVRISYFDIVEKVPRSQIETKLREGTK